MKTLYLLLIGFIVVLVVGSIHIKREQFSSSNISKLLSNPHDQTKEVETNFLYLNPPKGSKKFHEHDLVARGVQKRKCDVDGMCVVDTRVEF